MNNLKAVGVPRSLSKRYFRLSIMTLIISKKLLKKKKIKLLKWK